MTKYFIYKTTNSITGEFYFGKCTSEMINDKFVGNFPAIRQQGKRNFKMAILCHTESKELNKDLHSLLLDMVDTPLCLNMPHKSRGETKFTTPSRKRQAEKISGEYSASKRPEVRAKVSVAMSGEHHHMHGRTGDRCPNSKLSDAQRVEIIELFDSGSTRTAICDTFRDVVKPVTVMKIIQNRAEIKRRLSL